MKMMTINAGSLFRSSSSSSSSKKTKKSPSNSPVSSFSGSDDSWPAISRGELEAVLRKLNPGGSAEEEVASVVAELGGSDGSMMVSLEALGSGELREAFEVFDANGDGKISAEELMAVLVMLGDGGGGCSLEGCRRLIGGVDRDGDGFVCYEEFVSMMSGR